MSKPVDPARIRIVLVDDHSIVRRGLRSVLELEADVDVVGEAGDSLTARDVIRRCNPEIVLMDLKLSSQGPSEGLDLCSEVVVEQPNSRVVIFTAFMSYQLVLEAVKRGASGYALKDVDLIDLLRIVRAVHEGRPGFDSRAIEFIVGSVNDSGLNGLPVLNNREREVIGLVAKGLTNAQIGHQLFLSESTIKYHLRSINRKLGVNRRAEVAYLAATLGLF